MGYLNKTKNRRIQYPIEIIVDAREKKKTCWKFDPKLFTVVRRRLLVGDYTIKGFEHILAIERKSCFNEIITNIGRRKWFQTKMLNLSKYPIRYLIIEDDFSNLPRIFRNQQYGCVQPVNLFNWLYLITRKYNIPILFIGKHNNNYQKEFVENLFLNLLQELYYGKHP